MNNITINWIHIMDKQPEHNTTIVQCNYPYDVEESPYTPNDFKQWYTMGMIYFQKFCEIDDIIKYNKENDIPLPNYWWIYAKDFPFPKNKNIKGDS